MVLANSADWVIAYLAITRIGAHAILLNPFSRAPEVGYALAHSDAAIVVTGTQSGGGDAAELLAAAVPGIDTRTAGEPALLASHPFLRSVWWLGEDAPAWASDPWAASPVPPELLSAVEAEVHASDPMVTSYTSGTTAAPKAVVHSQGAIIRQAEKLSVRRHFTPDDLIWTPMPFFWMGGLCFVLLQAATARDARGHRRPVRPGQGPRPHRAVRHHGRELLAARGRGDGDARVVPRARPELADLRADAAAR